MKVKSGILAFFCAVASMSAATISVTYTYSVSAAGDPSAGPVIGTGSGSISSLGNFMWMDMANINLVTGAVRGTFTATFVNGTLFGNLIEQADLTAPPTATPITQTLQVLGGTGAFIWYNGSLAGSSVANLVTGAPATNNGSGTLNTTPEPGSLALIPAGLAALYLIRRKRPKQ